MTDRINPNKGSAVNKPSYLPAGTMACIINNERFQPAVKGINKRYFCSQEIHSMSDTCSGITNMRLSKKDNEPMMMLSK
jgi:hypothetical protein